MSLEQQFLSFLTSQITAKAARIEEETSIESAAIVAQELRSHVAELSKAIDALFADGAPTQRRGRRSSS